MKKFILAAVAATLVASPALAAVPQQHGQHGPQRVVVKKVYKPAPAPAYRSWKKGQRFDSRYARNYRQIDYRRYNRLKAPPRGYRYVQSGNDALLVGVTSGIIAAVIANAIN
jgi:Ni/Co efflux regulator RcnB